MTTMDLLKQLADAARSFVRDSVRDAVREVVREETADLALAVAKHVSVNVDESTLAEYIDSDAIARAVAGNVDVDASEIAEHIDTDTIASEIARNIDTDDIARHLELPYDFAEQVAGNLDTPEVDSEGIAESVAQHIDIDAGEVASALLDKLVAKLAPAPEPPAKAEDTDSATE